MNDKLRKKMLLEEIEGLEGDVRITVSSALIAREMKQPGNVRVHLKLARKQMQEVVLARAIYELESR